MEARGQLYAREVLLPGKWSLAFSGQEAGWDSDYLETRCQESKPGHPGHT
jgi:hypothetical protein